MTQREQVIAVIREQDRSLAASEIFTLLEGALMMDSIRRELSRMVFQGELMKRGGGIIGPRGMPEDRYGLPISHYMKQWRR